MVQSIARTTNQFVIGRVCLNGIEVVEQGDRVLWSPAVFASMIGEKLEGAPITSLDLTHVSQASDVTNAFLEMIN